MTTKVVRGGRRIYSFGPGSLESLTMSVYAERLKGLMADDAHQYRLITVKLDGFFSIYCGNGCEHLTVISELYVTTVSMDDRSRDPFERRVLTLVTDDDPYEADDLAHCLVENALEDWSDPCFAEEVA